jgi:ATP-dependent DNA helicase RecG
MVNFGTDLFYSLKELPGVGPKKYELLQNLGCSNFFDLLIHLPNRFIVKQFEPEALSTIAEGKHIIISISVKKVLQREGNQWSKKLTKVSCYNRFDEELELVFFNYFPEYIFRNIKLGSKLIVSGDLKKTSAGRLQLMHPKIYRTLSEIKKIEAIYPMVSGLSSAYLNKLILLCIENLEKKKFFVGEWLEPELLSKHNWLGFFESIKSLHGLQDEKKLEQQDKLRERIAFDELLANQLAIRISRSRNLNDTGASLKFSGELAQKILSSTGMTLTAGQLAASNDIRNDQRASKRMIRLLQGDVGSGKTLVALLAALNAVESGNQAALMVPTDILSKQHFNTISKLLEPFDIKVELLTGSTKKSKRKIISAELLSGEIKILIGTHALFQKGVEFKSLALCVIDEQHRFGVQQRLALMNKNKICDVLSMSATPIPRTLALIMYGDMDVSILKDKPAGRMPIRTMTTLDSKVNVIAEIIKKKISEEEKVFWVCPLIEEKEEEGEDIDAETIIKEPNYSTAVARYNFLKEIFGEKVGLVHGKLKDPEKEKSMNEFAHGNVDILVATTVIEVGIDVPEATLLVIERAERFGLSQLHQLRGRIGRGSKASDCILMFSEDISFIARNRLRTMKKSNDGFYIAEQDLKLRGGGEILGHKQSGLPEFKTVDFEKHYHLMTEVSEYADRIIKRGEIEKFIPLMKIFGYDVNLKLIDA